MSDELASAPAKVMLAGEYAVVEGGPALLVAVNRRAQARLADTPQALSPFLQAAADTLAAAGHDGAAERMQRVVVDSDAFRDGDAKLGLGSSAAVTVAALQLALGPDVDAETIYPLALGAHGDAQEAQGARGSGADIACSCFGGAVFLPAGEATSPRTPESITARAPLHLVFPWTGHSASTPELVARVRSWGAANAARYGQLQCSISDAAMTLRKAIANTDQASSVVEAIAAAGDAIRALSEASGAGLWLPVHDELAAQAAAAGGSLKSTGAGGGDLAVAAFESEERASRFRAGLEQQGILCPDLLVEIEGVRSGS